MRNQFKYIDKVFRLTTINTQKNFYYKITKPIDVWGNYHTQIAFFGRDNKIIYHRQDCFAHALQIDNSLEFVKWSDNGDFVLFYEYKRGPVPGDGIYDYVLIDLKEKEVYRLDLYKHNHEFLDSLRDNEFDGNQIAYQIINLHIDTEYCFKDKIIVDPLKWLIGIERWKPSGRL